VWRLNRFGCRKSGGAGTSLAREALGGTNMLAEFSILPLGVGEHLSGPLADMLDIVDRSGIRYKFMPSGTCLEGSWTEIMEVVRRCHDGMRKKSPHVFTTIRIEDEEGAEDKLLRNIASVEKKLGRRLAETGGIVR